MGNKTDFPVAVSQADFLANLVASGKMSNRDMDQVQSLQSGSNDSVSVLLTRLGFLSEEELAQCYALYLSIPRSTAKDFGAEPLKPERLSPSFLRKSVVFPYLDAHGAASLAMCDPFDDFSYQAMSFFLGKTPVKTVATTRAIESSIESVWADATSVEHQVVEGDSDDINRLRDLASEAPVIRLVQQLITGAIEQKASDIHIEPMEAGLSIRYRIDGMLQEVQSLPVGLRSAVVSRIKIMAHLNIAERRLPQDGRIRLMVHGRETDFRVASSPTMHGEAVVLRILDRRDVALDFGALGFGGDNLERLRDGLDQPHGIILVTGPTGSGKTTTLYAALKELNKPDRKILTAEDPIEYTLERVNQVQVRPQIGHDFAHALRSFLRQDPDIIMVGEIRDVETARVAIQASLTGHLLLSTLHTNSAAGAVTRLLDMGVEDYLLASTLTLVIGQRLVRRLCESCRESYPAPPSFETEIEQFQPGLGSPIFYRSKGCAACKGTGYDGRIAIAELLPVDESIQRLIVAKASTRDIERQAIAGGMRTMKQDGLFKILAGHTSLDEVLRVTQNV